MLAELKFVRGAIGKKDLVPALTHFKIEGGKIRSFNGTLALCTPIELDIDCVPKAIPFIKAIENCNETVSLALTKAQRLSVKSGNFKAFIDCVDDEVAPHVEPEGDVFDINGEEMLNALKALAPLIGDDAAKPWTNGILLNGQSAYATCNVILAEYWIGSVFPIVVNIPRLAVNELLRINQPPTHAQATANSITFFFEGDKWLRTNLLSHEWPDVGPILDVSAEAPMELTKEFFNALTTIGPFKDDMGRVYFFGGAMKTHQTDGEGAAHDLEALPNKGCYQLDMLQRLDGIGNTVDFSHYPGRCPFYGDRLRGVIIGMRE